jgi:hypothetical protein
MALNGYMFDFTISSERSKICPLGTGENGLFTVPQSETFVRCAGFYAACLFGHGAVRWPCARERSGIVVASSSLGSFGLERGEGDRGATSEGGAAPEVNPGAVQCNLLGG